TATRMIRAWERQQCASPTPIIALTADALQSTLLKCKQAGMTDALTKPIRIQNIHTIIAQYNPNISVNSEDGDEPGPPLPANPTNKTGPIELNTADLDANIGFMLPKARKELIERSQGNIDQYVHAIAQAVEQQDWATMEQMSHKLAGGAASLFLDATAQRARTMETALQAGNTSLAVDLFAQLQTALGSALQALQRWNSP
ncbi:MAG: Hpt domain-containing protein, partial [Magnetococcales bacterium]|nr:Hpt domain-containing protein [Magnetococcales bacterium]